jgi:lipooligosaccharide transport system permease protein
VDAPDRREEAEQVSGAGQTQTDERLIATVSHSRPLRALYAGNASSVMQRGWLATRSTNWLVVVSGFFEPIFYLLSLGVGLGKMVGDVATSSGQEVSYAAFIAPALLATAAMNGAVYDSTWNVFFKMHFAKLYEGMLSTSLGPLDVALGEILLALARGALYAIGFMLVMQVLGLNLSWWAILALPAVLLIAFGFASFGMGITSYMKTFQQMDWINFVMLPMFLLSATFYPLSVYPPAIQVVIQALPLWHGVELVRDLTTGAVDAGLLWHVLYFAVMIVLGLILTTRRLRALFLD